MKYSLFILTAICILLTGCSLLQIPQTKTDEINDPVSGISSDNESQNRIQQVGNRLDLSNQNLKKIPEYVFSQKNLGELDVSNNQLTGAIQAEIRQLKNLKTLNAGNNQMTGVPAEIGQLNLLEVLDLSNNQLTGLPYELGNLQNLKILNISGNNYSELDLGIITEKLPQDVDIIK